jgi:hypothetical protein
MRIVVGAVVMGVIGCSGEIGDAPRGSLEGTTPAATEDAAVDRPKTESSVDASSPSDDATSTNDAEDDASGAEAASDATGTDVATSTDATPADGGACGPCEPAAPVCVGDAVRGQTATCSAQGACVRAPVTTPCAAGEVCRDAACVKAPWAKYPTWLAYANELRSAYGSPVVVEDPAMSQAARAHAKYMVDNDFIGHSQDPTKPSYSVEGNGAAERGLVWATRTESDFARAMDAWQQAPFHLISLLDPNYPKMGYGEYLDRASPNYIWAVTLVVRDANFVSQPSRAFPAPMVWPPRNYVTHVARYWGENPDPLTGCPGYTAPAGLPLIASFGWWTKNNGGTTETTFRDGAGNALEHCRFDATNYVHPDPVKQAAARRKLEAYDAVFIVPRKPLEPKGTYRASVKRASGASVEWTFSVAPVIRING